MSESDALMIERTQELKPSLSSTSDSPVIKETVKEPVETLETVEVESPLAADKTETAENSANSDDDLGDDSAANADKPKQGKGVQKRIDELTRARGDAERLATDQSAKLAEALERIERLSADSNSRSQTSNETVEPRPSRDDYETPDAFTEGLAEWSGRQAVKSYQIEQNQVNQQQRAVEQFQKVTATWQKGFEKAIEAHPDFAEVIGNPELAIPHFVSAALANNSNGHEVAYYLGKNPAEATRIAAMEPFMAMMEIGALGVKLAPAAPETSKAPKPIKPVTGSRNDASSDKEMTMDERLSQLRNPKR